MLFVKHFCSAFLALSISQATGQRSESSHSNPGQTAVPGHYNPQVLYETYGAGIELPSALSRDTVKEAAASFVVHKLGLNNNQVTHRAAFSSDVTDHTYLNQVHNGIPFVNAVANVAIKDGKVVAFGSSFVKTDNIAPPNPTVNRKDAIAAAEFTLKCAYDSRPINLHYLANAAGSVSLVYVISVRNEESGEWYEAHVDAHSSELLSTVNYVARATYSAVPITNNSILDGQSLLIDPQDMLASPNGWHKDAQQFYDTTRGNNGYVSHGNHSASESSSGTYDYGYDTQLGPDTGNNQDAAIVNAFYIMNKVHDFTYRYGFTESAFNFQMNNFNRGGQENDGVIISVNNRTKFNNAGFGTPADGRSGTLNLYLFTYTKPLRSSAMDNSVVVHELGHGVSNRLVGGGTARCLTSIVNRGLGEGWSDMLADWTEQTSAITKDFTIGTYVVSDRDGLRRYPYSTNATVNPLKYSDVAKSNDSQHSIYPDFIAARDCVIQADENRYNCRHGCLIWKAFAKHGLGIDANGTTDGFKVPSNCHVA